ncbi:MAG: hypothetical protein WDO19_14805 [Bacteroidota bacterium]
MKRIYSRMITRFNDWAFAIKENKRLKKDISSLAHCRNQLLQIIGTGSRIEDAGYNGGEPLFIAIKESVNSINFYLYNYNPAKLVTATIAVTGNEWDLLNIEAIATNRDELKLLLLNYIRNEAKKSNTRFNG